MEQTFASLLEQLKTAEKDIIAQGSTSLSGLTSLNQPKYLLVPKQSSQQTEKRSVRSSVDCKQTIILQSSPHKVNFKILQYLYSLKPSEFLRLRLLCKESLTIVNSYVQSIYILTIKTLPPVTLTVPVSLKILNTLHKIQSNQPGAVTSVNNLIKHAALTGNKQLIKHCLKSFIKMIRQQRPYKEFMLSKKHLELTIIRDILTQRSLIKYAIEVNSSDTFDFLLKEFKVSYKDQLFENNDVARKMFRCVNVYGNIHILKEIFKFYPKLYQEVLQHNIEQNGDLCDNWIVSNCIRSHSSCLEFNLRVLEKKNGIDWLKHQFPLIGVLIFRSIVNPDLKILKTLIRFVDLQARQAFPYQMTPFEYSLKRYDGKNLQVIEELLNREIPMNIVPQIPGNKKCHILYMIRKDLPIAMIKQLISLYPSDKLVIFRDKEHKSLLYHAIEMQNMELIRLLMPFYDLLTYFERATDGTYPELVAAKSKNMELKKMIDDFLMYKETQEFLEEEWRTNPNVPERLLLLKKQLFPGIGIPGIRDRSRYRYRLKEIHKAKRTKSQPKDQLQKFDKFSEYMRYKVMSEFQRKTLVKHQTMGTQALEYESVLFSPHLSTGSYLEHQEIGSEPMKINYEKKNSVFHQNEYRLYLNKNFTYLPEDQIIDYFKSSLERLFLAIAQSYDLVLNQPAQHFSHTQVYIGSKSIDNSDLRMCSSYKDLIRPHAHINNQRHLNFARSQQNSFHFSKRTILNSSSLVESPGSQNMLCTIQSYFKQKVVNERGSSPNAAANASIVENSQAQPNPSDETTDLLIRIITDLTKADVRYQDMNLEGSMDVHKMTIAQKSEYDKHRVEQKKIFQQLQKDYLQKLKIANQTKKTAQTDQNEVEQIISEQINTNTASGPNHLRNYSNNSQERQRHINDLIESTMAAHNESSIANSFQRQKTIKVSKPHVPELKIRTLKRKQTYSTGAQWAQLNSQDQQPKKPKDDRSNSGVSHQQKQGPKKVPQIGKYQSQVKLTPVNTGKNEPFQRRNTITQISKKILKIGKSSSSGNISDEEAVAKQIENISELNTVRTDENDKINEDITDEVGKIGGAGGSGVVHDQLNKIEEESQMLEAGSPLITKKRNFLKKLTNQNSESATNKQVDSTQKGSSNFLKLKKTKQIEDGEEQNNQEQEELDEITPNNDIEIQDLNQDINSNDKKLYMQFSPDLKPQRQNDMPLHIKNLNSEVIMRNSRGPQYRLSNAQISSSNNEMTSPLQGFATTSNPGNDPGQMILTSQYFSGAVNTNSKRNHDSSNNKLRISQNGLKSREHESYSLFSGLASVPNKNGKSTFQTMSQSSLEGTKTKLKPRLQGLPPAHPKRLEMDIVDFQGDQVMSTRISVCGDDNMMNPQQSNFNKYRYKDAQEEQEIKKIVKNINVLRWMKGSPLRLYPQYFQHAKSINASANQTQSLSLLLSKSHKSFMKNQSKHGADSNLVSSPEIKKQQVFKNIKNKILQKHAIKYQQQQSQNCLPMLVEPLMTTVHLQTKNGRHQNYGPDTFFSGNSPLNTRNIEKVKKQLKKLKVGPRNHKISSYGLVPQGRGVVDDRKIVFSTLNSQEQSPLQKNLQKQYLSIDEPNSLRNRNDDNKDRESFGSSGEYKGIENTYQHFRETLNQHPNINNILYKNKRFYNKLKNSDVEVPFQLSREVNNIEKQSIIEKSIKSSEDIRNLTQSQAFQMIENKKELTSRQQIQEKMQQIRQKSQS